MPVVSPKPISWAPASRSRAAISSTRSGGTWPSYGQPNDVEMTPSQRSPSARARPSTTSKPASDSPIERLTFLRLWVSEADMNTLISSNAGRPPPSPLKPATRSRSSSAASSPRSLGISTDTLTSAGTSIPASTCAASASCGITSARTKLVTSRRFTPVRASASISSTLTSVGTTSGSF